MSEPLACGVEGARVTPGVRQRILMTIIGRQITGAAFVCLTLLLCFADATAQVLMRDEPHHHFVFETDAFRVFEPRIGPGEVTLDHRHAFDMVTVCLGGSAMRNRAIDSDWSKPGATCTTGSVVVSEYAGRESSHRVENVGTEMYRLLAIENLRVSDWSRRAPVVEPFTSVLREDRAFNVYEIELKSTTDRSDHLHQATTIIVLVSGQALVTVEDPYETSHLEELGRWLVVPAGKRHSVTTAAPAGARAIEIEIR